MRLCLGAASGDVGGSIDVNNPRHIRSRHPAERTRTPLPCRANVSFAVVRGLSLSEEKAKLLYAQQIQGPKGKKERYEIEFDCRSRFLRRKTGDLRFPSCRIMRWNLPICLVREAVSIRVKFCHHLANKWHTYRYRSGGNSAAGRIRPPWAPPSESKTCIMNRLPARIGSSRASRILGECWGVVLYPLCSSAQFAPNFKKITKG